VLSNIFELHYLTPYDTFFFASSRTRMGHTLTHLPQLVQVIAFNLKLRWSISVFSCTDFVGHTEVHAPQCSHFRSFMFNIKTTIMYYFIFKKDLGLFTTY
jgi:hypothetical protein